MLNTIKTIAIVAALTVVAGNTSRVPTCQVSLISDYGAGIVSDYGAGVVAPGTSRVIGNNGAG